MELEKFTLSVYHLLFHAPLLILSFQKDVLKRKFYSDFIVLANCVVDVVSSSIIAVIITNFIVAVKGMLHSVR